MFDVNAVITFIVFQAQKTVKNQNTCDLKHKQGIEHYFRTKILAHIAAVLLLAFTIILDSFTICFMNIFQAFHFVGQLFK